MTKGMSPKDVLGLIKDKHIRAVDIRFCDLFGQWQHFTLPSTMVNEGSFTDGHGFDGSSIRGWKSIDESDMLVVPDPDTAVIDPFFAEPTVVMIANVVDPITKEDYARDPRGVARRAEQYLQSTGIGDTMYVGPEPEFFIFDSVHFDNNPWSSYYSIDSDEGPWNTGAEGPNHGHRPRLKGGYLPVPPVDQLQDLRGEMMHTMENVGIEMERQHHEVAGAGQAEIDMKYDSLVSMGDKLQWFKYIVRQCAVRAGKTATFMPKPLFGDNGSGMHCHFSIWKDGKPQMAGNQYADLSELCLHFIGGVIKHAKACNAFTNPSTNSYKRLVPGYEAPVLLAYSSRNRSASCRIPHTSNPKAKRVEVRFPDPAANPYLAFSALLMAGLDGVVNKIHPGDAMDKNLYDLPPAELRGIPTVCGSLREALTSLDKDREFLKKGGVFTDDQIDSFIELKMEENMRYEMMPHPVEFDMYYSC
ncbi:MAG TPA: type I glutamate--ammonia ligase [Planctomycetota bacterium]|nr:type I glutamate--ammonia ligase [Planctomycetota bacterium]